MDRKQLEQDYIFGLMKEVVEVFRLEKKGIAQLLNVSEVAVQKCFNRENGIARKHHETIKRLHKALYSVVS